MAFPVRDVIKPSALAGQSNGRIDPSKMIGTPGQAGGATVTLVAPAHRAWRALAAAALKAGHTLKIGWPNSSYRSYEDQKRIFLERYRTAYKANTDVKRWDGKTWYRWYGATAAAPGTSNHGWGLAVDVGEESDGDAGTESVDSATVNWLVANEQRFGFSHEIQTEPWHIRYFAGDDLPQAVLDFEGPSGSTQEEDDMQVVVWFESHMGPAAYKCDGLTATWIPSPDELDVIINFWKTPVFNSAGSPAPARGLTFIDGPNKTMFTLQDLPGLLDSIEKRLIAGLDKQGVSGADQRFTALDKAVATISTSGATGLSLDQVKEAMRAVVVEKFGPIFDLPGE